MSYVPSDFDNLNAGFNILDIKENTSNFANVEGTYSDKGLGIKQQYSLYGATNWLVRYPDYEESNITMDFCLVLKGGFTGNSKLISYNGTGTTISQEIDLSTLQHTVTQDSNGNEVWLYEDFSIRDLIEISTMSENSVFCIFVEYKILSSITLRKDICALNRGGAGVNPELPEKSECEY